MDAQTTTEGTATQGTATVAVTETPAAFDPTTIPPDFKPHYEAAEKHFASEREKAIAKATEELKASYSEVEQRAKGFDSLISDPRFQEFRKSLDNPQPKQEQRKGIFDDLTGDDYVSLINDPKKFGAHLEKVIAERAAADLKPQVEKVAAEADRMKLEGELKEFAAKNTDFWDKGVNAKFNEIARRYKGALSIEDTYFLAKREQIEKEAEQKAIQKAHQIVEEKRQASLEKPGVSSARSTGAPIKVRSNVEAMQIAVEYQKAGREIPEFEYVS